MLGRQVDEMHGVLRLIRSHAAYAVIVAALLGVGIAAGGLVLVRTFIHSVQPSAHNDVVAALIEVEGVIYGVLLAFVVVVVWQHFNSASEAVEHEAQALADLLRDAQALPPGKRQEVHTRIRAYVDVVIADEWAVMREGRQSPLPARRSLHSGPPMRHSSRSPHWSRVGISSPYARSMTPVTRGWRVCWGFVRGYRGSCGASSSAARSFSSRSPISSPSRVASCRCC